jgi:stress response protein YsnF
MDEKNQDLVIPIIREDVHADAIPVVTGGVRVTKRVESHDEIVEQELRRSHVEVKRVKTDRVVDGPQPIQRVGKTLIVPVVSEVIRIEKQWVVTEEIHITETEERETVRNRVTLNSENADVQRLNAVGDVVSTEVNSNQVTEPATMLRRTGTSRPSAKRRDLSRTLLRRETDANDVTPE